MQLKMIFLYLQTRCGSDDDDVIAISNAFLSRNYTFHIHLCKCNISAATIFCQIAIGETNRSQW